MTLSRMFDPVTMASFSRSASTPSAGQWPSTSTSRPVPSRVLPRRHAPDERSRRAQRVDDFVIIETIKWMADNGYAGSASTSPPCGPSWPARTMVAVAPHGALRPPPVQRHHADRVAVGLQQEVRARVASRYVVTDASATRRVPDLPSPGRGGHRVAVRRSAAQCPCDTNQPAATPRAPGVDVALAEPAGRRTRRRATPSRRREPVTRRREDPAPVLIGVNVSSVSGWLPPAVILVAAVTLVLSIGWYIGDWKLQLLVGCPRASGS